ncbi:hypothetical protein ACFL3G_07700 [Planctomycetota bacterium]
MQIDSISSAPINNVSPSAAAVAETENNETSADEAEDTTSSSPVDSAYSESSSVAQESSVNPASLIVSKVTLEQLLEAATPTVEKLLGLDETEDPELFEKKAEEAEESEPTGLPAETELKAMLRKSYYERIDRKQKALIDAWRGSWYETIAEQSIGDILTNVNALLKDANLTKEQFELLVSFNSTAKELTQSFAVPNSAVSGAADPNATAPDSDVSDKTASDSGVSDMMGHEFDISDKGMPGVFKLITTRRRTNPAVTKVVSPGFNISHEDALTKLQSAFDALAESLGSITQPAPKIKQDLESLFATKIDRFRNALKNTIATKKKVTKMVDGWTERLSFEKLISFDVDQMFDVLSEEMVYVPNLTKEDVAEILDGWAYTAEQKENVQELMPQFLEGLKTHMSTIGYNVRYS